MIWLIIISILILLSNSLFLLFNELEDEVVRDRSKNHPTKLVKWYSKIKNIPLTSGANAKWYEPLQDYNSWYYPKFMKKPNHKERFIYSSTIFVSFTDMEHLYQFIKLRFINISALLFSIIIHIYTDFSWYSYIPFIASILGLYLTSFIKEAFIKKLN